jgi:hypothetical protein
MLRCFVSYGFCCSFLLSPDGEVAGSTNKCATDVYSSHNPKVFDQCVAVCIECDQGVTTTYSTSCTLLSEPVLADWGSLPRRAHLESGTQRRPVAAEARIGYEFGRFGGN